MKFTKPAISLEDQIDLLKRRGMHISDRERAAHYLRHISYYRLRAYWLPFETTTKVNGDHAFAADVSFDHVLALYIFDRELRLLLIDAIERIEVSLRAGWVQYMGLKYGAHGYLNPELYDARFYEKDLSTLNKEIGRSRDIFIRHYRKKYSEPEMPPIWMAGELISLGQLSKWLGHLKHRTDRQAISKLYELDEKILCSFVHHMTTVRNICAHHSRLWDRHFDIQPILPKSPSKLVVSLNKEAPGRLYNTLALITYFLGIVAPGSEWKNHLIQLIDGCEQADPLAMGFPDNWRSLTLWKKPEE